MLDPALAYFHKKNLTSFTSSIAQIAVPSVSFEVITTAIYYSGIPEHAVVVERMNMEVLNLSIKLLRSQKTISLDCMTFL